MSSSVIELNGRMYDANTGRALPATPLPQHSGKVIDGFVRAKQAHHAAAVHQRVHTAPVRHSQAARAAQPAPRMPKTFDVRHHSTPHHTQAHHPQHAKTLMRDIVHQPAPSLKRHVKAVTRTDILVRKPRFDVVPKHSVQNIDPHRLQRAKRIARSRLISRFGTLQLQPTHPAAASKPAMTAPKLDTLPAIGRVESPMRQPSSDIFERALAMATSHRQPPYAAKPAKRGRRLRRAASFAASSITIVLIIGFIAYQNAANLHMRLAAARAGISATLPGWQPNGYRAAKFSYRSGNVTVSFISPATDRSFSLTQTATNWSSAALLSDYVDPNNEHYGTITSAGTTIYTYGNNNATWVNGGIWYKLNTNGALSTSQIVRIADSM